MREMKLEVCEYRYELRFKLLMLRSVTADMNRDSFFVALAIGRCRLAAHSAHVGVPVLVDRLSDVDLVALDVAPATDFVRLGIDEAV